MRTVTFSNADVAKAINESFICTWKNRIPEFNNKSKAQEQNIKSTSYECFPTKNFATFFATPEMKVLSYLSGYYNPTYFQQEVKFVSELAKEALDEKMNFKEQGWAAFAKKHTTQAKLRRQDLVDLAESRKLKDKLSKDQKGNEKERQWHLTEGLTHLAAVHVDLAERTGNARKPTPLSDVFSDHLFGNPFTEE